MRTVIAITASTELILNIPCAGNNFLLRQLLRTFKASQYNHVSGREKQAFSFSMAEGLKEFESFRHYVKAMAVVSISSFATLSPVSLPTVACGQP